MSNQPSDINSFFDQVDNKKKKQATQQQQAKKAEEQRKKQEEEKKNHNAASTKLGAIGSTADFESSDEEENRGKIEIVGGGVKDIKQVKKEKQQKEKLKEQDSQGWNLGAPSTSTPSSEAKAA